MPHAMTISFPADTQIVVARSFAAPRALVWRAFTTPELIRKWLFGPPGWVMTRCEEDLRPGGRFEWAWAGPNGEKLAMHGLYREVSPPSRIVRTETFDMGCPSQAGEQLGVMELEEAGGVTRMTVTITYPSKQARDGAIASGMEHGMAAGYDRLEAMLAAGM